MVKSANSKVVFFTFLLFIILIGCQPKKQKSDLSSDFTFGVWLSANKNETDQDFLTRFEKIKDSGIDEILVDTRADALLLKRIVPIAKKTGLKVHAWVKTVNRAEDSVALKHPSWYMVSREGKSCFDHRPYVDYYQWLCPTRKASKNHIFKLIRNLSKVDGIESVHLDYIRFPDVFLPIGLLPKYNLTQSTELPEFDFCYCDTCITYFKNKYHKDPRKMAHPQLDMEWRQFRLNRIKNIVDKSYKIAHQYRKKLTAAVFPYPEMAGNMVRQRWDKWDIDGVYPMVYHNFYNESVDWIGTVTAQDVSDLESKQTFLKTGLFLPGFSSAKELKKAIFSAKNSGATGVALFDDTALKPEFIRVIKQARKELK